MDLLLMYFENRRPRCRGIIENKKLYLGEEGVNCEWLYKKWTMTDQLELQYSRSNLWMTKHLITIYWTVMTEGWIQYTRILKKWNCDWIRGDMFYCSVLFRYDKQKWKHYMSIHVNQCVDGVGLIYATEDWIRITKGVYLGWLNKHPRMYCLRKFIYT